MSTDASIQDPQGFEEAVADVRLDTSDTNWCVYMYMYVACVCTSHSSYPVGLWWMFLYVTQL